MTMTVTPDRRSAHHVAKELWSSPPRPTARPTTVVRHGPVVALRQRSAISLGALAERTPATCDRLVTAHDEAGQGWWIAASGVWSDADSPNHPENPLPIGLATAPTREAALVAGLSDRLGWEAVLEFERGQDLPVAEALAEFADEHVVILDGRLGHDVPTVVVLGRDMVRWGAAATWHGAMRRAMYGDTGNDGVHRELGQLSEILGRSGLGIAAVDLDSPLLRRAGIARCSVQLVQVG
jgi:hypothetical protein